MNFVDQENVMQIYFTFSSMRIFTDGNDDLPLNLREKKKKISDGDDDTHDMASDLVTWRVIE